MKRRLIAATLISLFSLGGCARPSIEAALRDVAAATPETIDQKLKALEEKAGAGLSLRDADLLLEASKKEYAKRKYDFQNTQVDILRCLRGYANPDIVGGLEDRSQGADTNVNAELVFILSRIDSPDAVQAVFSILKNSGDRRPASLTVPGWEKDKIQARAVFPGLLAFLDVPQYRFQIALLTLFYLEDRKITQDDIEEYLPGITAEAQAAAARLSAVKPEGTRKTRWYRDDYLEPRNELSVFLDLFGYLDTRDTEDLLNEFLRSADPRLSFFSLASLIRRGQAVDQPVIDAVARDDEMRKWLFTFLKEKNLLDRMDERYRTQEELAASDLVNWLIYPTELGTAPDRIELLKKVTVDTQSADGTLEYFIFKFRTLAPHWAAKDGWMVGVSGPFKVTEYPSVDAYGETFSAFEKLDDRPPEAYLNRVRDLIDGASQERAGR